MTVAIYKFNAAIKRSSSIVLEQILVSGRSRLIKRKSNASRDLGLMSFIILIQFGTKMDKHGMNFEFKAVQQQRNSLFLFC